jgi:predicted  nucleic acid-binding Zn-ribbon protein
MRVRHRVPSIFNLSMVDVLCCALGCVILLWLLNLREVRRRAEEAGRTDQQLTATLKDLAATVEERDTLRRRLAEATDQFTDLSSQYRTLQGQLTDSGRQLADTRKRLAASEEQGRGTSALLTKTQGERDAARTQAADLDKLLAALRVEKKDAEDRLAREKLDAGELEKRLTARLQDAEAALRKLQALADLVPDLQDKVKGYREKLAAEEALSKGLEKEMADKLRELATLSKDLAARDRNLNEARTVIEGLETEKKTLRNETDRLRASADNRFAGVTLTGRRVMFLVDMSGSMELVDENTPAPEKWQGVRDTLAKVLRSMPDVEKFQVIVFAARPYFLLGNEGRWLSYDSKASPDQVTQALARIKPDGGTNMYSAMEAAFRYRDQGLDTIYLLSDGLPNQGEPLRPDQLKSMSETEKGEILGKYIRRALKGSWNRPVEGQPRVRINAIGFFYESPDVGAFLWALARENDGSFVGMSKP